MSNSNFTPETLPSFPLSTLLPSLQWRVEKGWKDSQRMTGRARLDVPCKYIQEISTKSVAQKAVKRTRKQQADICNKKCDVLLFILPYTLPCGPLGGKACCFLASAAWAGGCLLQHSGTWLCWQLAPHAAFSPSLPTRSSTEGLRPENSWCSVRVRFPNHVLNSLASGPWTGWGWYTWKRDCRGAKPEPFLTPLRPQHPRKSSTDWPSVCITQPGAAHSNS